MPEAAETAVEHVAVLLVPGIFASHLTDPNGGLAWPVNQTAAMLRHIVFSPSMQRNAFLDQDAVRFIPYGPKSAVPSGVDVESGWQNVFAASYQPFMSACAAGGPSGTKTLPFEPHLYGLGYN